MNNMVTTTTIRDTVSITGRGDCDVDSFDVNFNQDSSNINSGDYSLTTVENYPTFLKFIENTLSNFDLLNKDEIINFIVKNLGLIDLIEKVEPIIENHFPQYDCCLEFSRDPEIPNFNKIILYVKGNDESFDDDWEEIKKINREIRNLTLYDDDVRNNFSLDLW